MNVRPPGALPGDGTMIDTVMGITRLFIFAMILSGFAACSPPPPEPSGPAPSPRQLAWHAMKYYAFIHFGPNTFTNREWGYGDEPESLFNPTELDCRQWARVARDAGMEGIVLTAKHHDGFCLWPSAYTEHSVKNSPWKEGNGDVVRELSDACREFGLKMGIYLSPWDRNHALYGTPAYLEYYRNQLRELLTNYGDVFEVWFDGANGGDGYYGGARETRRIDNTTYYDWPETWKIVRDLQPMAVMFSDGGPDVRWIGNERGYAGDPNWCTVRTGVFYPGIPDVIDQLQTGHEDGDVWLPAEVNTSIRPGWFYHPEQDTLVKTVSRLVDIWYHSVGMNGNFILNIPPDRRGLIHENDIGSLMGLKRYLDEAFGVDLTRDASATAGNTRGGAEQFGPGRVIDDDPESYWSTDDSVNDAEITIALPGPVELNAVEMREYLPLGQRVGAFTVSVETGGQFRKAASGMTIGNRRIVRFGTVRTAVLKISFSGKASPAISDVGAYRVPEDPASFQPDLRTQR